MRQTQRLCPGGQMWQHNASAWLGCLWHECALPIFWELYKTVQTGFSFICLEFEVIKIRIVIIVHAPWTWTGVFLRIISLSRFCFATNLSYICGKTCVMADQSTYNSIKRRVEEAGRGALFFPDTFADAGTSDAVPCPASPAAPLRRNCPWKPQPPVFDLQSSWYGCRSVQHCKYTIFGNNSKICRKFISNSIRTNPSTTVHARRNCPRPVDVERGISADYFIF